MFEDAVLDVLARAAEIGLPEHVTLPASRYDPFLRPSIKKRVRAAVVAANERTSRGGEHLLRVAFLVAHPESGTFDANDERAVLAAFEKLAAPWIGTRTRAPAGGAYRDAAVAEPLVTAVKKKPRWLLTTAFVTTLVAGTATTATSVAIPYLTPTPYAKFADTEFGKSLGEPLTAVLSEGDLSKKPFTTIKIDQQVGEPAADAVDKAVTLAVRGQKSDLADLPQTLATIATAINEADEQLALAHVPASIHSWGHRSDDGPQIWVTSYFVEERATATMGNHPPFSVIWGRRLDRLNLSDRLLWKSDDQNETVLTLPLVEEELVQVYLPPLAYGRAMLPDAGDDPRGELARVAARQISAEITSSFHLQPIDANALSVAIVVRNQKLDELARQNWPVMPSSQPWLSPATSWRINAAANDNAYVSQLAREIQRADDHMKIVMKPAEPLLHHLAEWEEEAFFGYLVEHDRSAGAFATVARPRASTKIALWQFIRPLVEYDARAYVSATSLTILQKLFSALGLAPPGSVLDDDVERGLAQIMTLPPDRIRDAAGRVFADVFGHPVLPYSRTIRP